MKRVLFVSVFYPKDFERATHGVYVRMRLLLEAVQRVAETIEILFFVPREEDSGPQAVAVAQAALLMHWKLAAEVNLCRSDAAGETAWRDRLRSIVAIEKHPGYSEQSGHAQIRAVKEALWRNPDAVVVHRLSSMVPFLALERPVVPIFFDLDDVEHRKRLRELLQPPFWLGKVKQLLELPAIYRAEKAAAKLADRTFVCSDLDQRYLSARGFPRVAVIPNAVRIPAEMSLPAEKTLLFLGSYTYGPNVSAANLLITVIWPRIRSRVPDASLVIAGGRPERLEAFDAPPSGVHFAGFVGDLDSLYHRTMVVCCPILYGGGTRVKIIEAAAYGRPVVSTTVGAEGIGLEPGRSIELRDDPAALADACVELLQDRARAERMGRAARVYAAAHFNRERIVSELASSIATATPKAPSNFRQTEGSGHSNPSFPPVLDADRRE